jgi:hypothetical protein
VSGRDCGHGCDRAYDPPENFSYIPVDNGKASITDLLVMNMGVRMAMIMSTMTMSMMMMSTSSPHSE